MISCKVNSLLDCPIDFGDNSNSRNSGTNCYTKSDERSFRYKRMLLVLGNKHPIPVRNDLLRIWNGSLSLDLFPLPVQEEHPDQSHCPQHPHRRIGTRFCPSFYNVHGSLNARLGKGHPFPVLHGLQN